MFSFTDQLNRTISFPTYPQRIISVVPSQTELLSDLGLEKELFGITKFCTHPKEWFRSKTKIGGTKTIKMDIIHLLHPDLIIANKEENTKEQMDALAIQYPVWVSDVHNLKTALQMITMIGELTNKLQKANQIANQIKYDFNNFSNQLPVKNQQLPCAYLIWKDPYMTVGGDTFINDMLNACGLKNVFQHLTRYPTILIDDLKAIDCQLLLLSSEPYPFARKHLEELQVHLPGKKIILVDGEMFSWYGSRLLHATRYFQSCWLMRKLVRYK